MNKLPVVAILPAFNEAARIGPVVKSCLEFVQKVIVIDDGSKDRTTVAAENAGAVVVCHPENKGKGAAILTAFDAFGKETLPWLALLDSDGQHDPMDIAALYRTAEEGGYDLVLGDRMEDTTHMPLIRIATNRFMSWVISRIAGQRMPDTQCGFRLFSRRLLGSINLQLTTTHYDLESEILFQIAAAGHRIGSCRVKTIYRGEPSHINPFIDTLRFIRLVTRTLSARRS
jgi:polyprenyl-phospho-N-acetylgalactosaminyl synthase